MVIHHRACPSASIVPHTRSWHHCLAEDIMDGQRDTCRARSIVGIIAAVVVVLGDAGAARAQVTFERLHAFSMGGSGPLRPTIQGTDGNPYGVTTARGAPLRGHDLATHPTRDPP